MRVSKKKLDAALKAEASSLIFEKFVNISSQKAAESFLYAFFTTEEIELILKKASIMILLSNGFKYRDICEKLEVSKNTVSKVQNLLSGAGYRLDPARKKPKSTHFETYPSKSKSGFERLLTYKGARLPFL